MLSPGEASRGEVPEQARRDGDRHGKHYMGFVVNLERRLAQHAAGTGARLMEVISEAGIGFTLVRTWEGTRALERRKKRQGGATRYCPICKAQLTLPPL